MRIPVFESVAKECWADQARYQELYARSMENSEEFWREQATRLEWMTPFTQVKQTRFAPDVSIRWYEGGTLNVSTNCVDRHARLHGERVAIVWEGDSPEEVRHITYRALRDAVCQFANLLKAEGVKKGDRVVIYLPMIPEAAIAMLACARIGAVHSVVFAGFSAESLKGRIADCAPVLVITADEGRRGGKMIPLKATVDDALTSFPTLRRTLVVKHTGGAIAWNAERDRWVHEELSRYSTECLPEPMGAEDPLFILYTSGSTGTPKGVLHTTGGYLVYASMTHRYVFNYQAGQVYWCTADVGWITGHSYVVYGPLANGATTLMFEGVPHYPSLSRFWEVIDRHQVNIFYTAPTAIRALMKEGDDFVTRTSRQSLRVLGSVGEPINPEAWLWYFHVVGGARCPVVDTWWQTETGGILITPLPGATELKPGSATLPFFGVEPVIVDSEGKELVGEAEGNLCIRDSWPGQARSFFGNHARFEETYFRSFPGLYFTGDGARRDADGYYWITGRVDDVLNVSGHRLGTAEIESALVAHPMVAEAAVVGFPHDVKGQAIYAFVTLNTGVQESATLRTELIQWVAKEISAIAKPEILQFAAALPKTRSGKIMRRILRKIAENDVANLGDTNTLTNPECVAPLIEGRSL